MSTQVLSVNGHVVGSANYFKVINGKEAILSEISADWAKNTYFDNVATCAGKVAARIQLIYNNLLCIPRLLQRVPQRDKDQLTNFVQQLIELANYGHKSYGKAADCQNLLNLSDSRTRWSSGATNNQITDAIRLIKNGQVNGKKTGLFTVTESERVNLVTKVSRDGEKAANRSNEDKVFIQALMGRVSASHMKAFCNDVMLAYLYEKNPTAYIPCSFSDARYYLPTEQKIFAKTSGLQISRATGTNTYVGMIIDALTRIEKKMETDLSAGVKAKNSLPSSNGDQLREAVAQLTKCGVKCGSMISYINTLDGTAAKLAASTAAKSSSTAGSSSKSTTTGSSSAANLPDLPGIKLLMDQAKYFNGKPWSNQQLSELASFLKQPLQWTKCKSALITARDKFDAACKKNGWKPSYSNGYRAPIYQAYLYVIANSGSATAAEAKKHKVKRNKVANPHNGADGHMNGIAFDATVYKGSTALNGLTSTTTDLQNLAKSCGLRNDIKKGGSVDGVHFELPK